MNNEDFGYDQNQNRGPEDGGAYQSAQADAENISEVIENLSKPRTMIYSVLSLILGIASFILCCCGGWFGLGLGVLAIVFSIVSRRHLGYFDGMSIAGLVLGICGTVFGLVVVALNFLTASGMLDAYLEQFFLEMEEDLGGDFPRDEF